MKQEGAKTARRAHRPKNSKETREAIAWYEKSVNEQKQLLEKSINRKRGYVTTNYTLAKGKKAGHITRGEYDRQQKVFSALQKTSQYLAVETDITVILEKIAKTIAPALGATQASFWDFTPDKKGAFIIAAYGIQRQYIEHSRKDPLPIGGAWLGRAMSTGQAWATSDIQKDPVLPKSWLKAVKKQNYHGLLCAPLMRKNEIIGGICIYHKNPHEYQFFEINVMTIVANQAATALENARIFGDLRAERNKTLSIIQSLTDGLIMYDPEGRITFFNPRAQEFLLVDLKDVMGKKITPETGKKNVYLKNLAMIASAMHKDYSTKEFTTEGPQKMVLEVTQIPVRDQKTVKIGTVHILHDLTREKEVEQLKASFVSTASHQLRTPLTGMKWSLDALLKGEQGALVPRQKELIARVFTTNEALIKLVNDLLDASRIEEGRFGYVFRPGNLLELTEDVIQELQPYAEKNKITLTVEKPAGPLPAVSMDGAKLKLAIQNVVDNAIKYTKAGGHANIQFKKRGDSLALNVEDNGIGIPEKYQKFIFRKFFRAENAIRFKTEGSGLGLFIAKGITEKHNGAISFTSKENAGSTFSLRFPLNPAKMPKGEVKGI